jgi:hypothetical protein
MWLLGILELHDYQQLATLELPIYNMICWDLLRKICCVRDLIAHSQLMKKMYFGDIVTIFSFFWQMKVRLCRFVLFLGKSRCLVAGSVCKERCEL